MAQQQLEAQVTEGVDKRGIAEHHENLKQRASIHLRPWVYTAETKMESWERSHSLEDISFTWVKTSRMLWDKNPLQKLNYPIQFPTLIHKSISNSISFCIEQHLAIIPTSDSA